jgi:uncharacterized membrane protein YhaH (DUF805 family)
MWPTFLVLTVLDALIGHALPPQGDSQTLIGAALVAVFGMLIGIIVIAPALAVAIRRVRIDMPRVVAHNYAGTAVILALSVVLLAAGLAHHPSVQADRAALADATARARDWVRLHAPEDFRQSLGSAQSYAIQQGVYRTCFTTFPTQRTFCVVVEHDGRSVRPAGSEPNSVIAAGAG